MAEAGLAGYGQKIKVGNGRLNVYTEGSGTRTIVFYPVQAFLHLFLNTDRFIADYPIPIKLL